MATQLVLGHYPMTIAQMNEWAKLVSHYTPAQCALATNALNGVKITPARPG